ncbi:hypothetical protein QBZ16_000340 [Prototheca wickerhamii]|uniref:Uncharacterized protein n=1 Tax=Prototheca wickerhamii TaxID=3111 RepID=A0AAD9IPT6_PROWI|nr:hypothetical protein QBZ16_000340 [Prototheca wickerhamii]
MDPKHIPRASPQDIARQKRLLGVALVAGAGVLYWVITRSDETKTTVNRAKADAETAGDRIKDAAYEAKQAGKEAWSDAKDKAAEAKRDIEKKF